ncbi:MAG: acyl-CoA thioesterase [Acidimicrobiia bacterium]
MPVVRGLCSGMGTLFGGCALGASIEILEHMTERPLVWATAQFLEFARPPSVVELEATEVVHGHASSQARVLAHVDGQEIFTVVAALGRRTLPWEGEWAVRPDLPSVADSKPRPLAPRFEGTIAERLAMRLANGRDTEHLDGTPTPDGRSALWVRVPFGTEATAAALAIVADYVPFGVGQALGHQISGNSIDNTLRLVRAGTTEWVLADVRVQAVSGGFGHGVVHLWAEDGTLLATASQSVIVRDQHTGSDDPERRTSQPAAVRRPGGFADPAPAETKPAESTRDAGTLPPSEPDQG